MNSKLAILFLFFLIHASNGQSLHQKEMAGRTRIGEDEGNANDLGDEASADSSSAAEVESFSEEKYPREEVTNAINVEGGDSGKDFPRERVASEESSTIATLEERENSLDRQADSAESFPTQTGLNEQFTKNEENEKVAQQNYPQNPYLNGFETGVTQQNASNGGYGPRDDDKTNEVHGNTPRSSESAELSKSSYTTESSESAKNNKESEEGPRFPESSQGYGHSSAEEDPADEMKPVEVQFDCYPQRGNVLRSNPQQQNRTVQMAAHIKVYLHCDRPRESSELGADFLMKCGEKNSYFDNLIGIGFPIGNYQRHLCGFSVSAVCKEDSQMMDIANVCEEKCAKNSCDSMPDEEGRNSVENEKEGEAAGEEEHSQEQSHERAEEVEEKRNGGVADDDAANELNGNENENSSDAEGRINENGEFIIDCYPQQTNSSSTEIPSKDKYLKDYARVKVYSHCANPARKKLAMDLEKFCTKDGKYNEHISRESGTGGFGITDCGHGFSAGVSCTENDEVFISYRCIDGCVENICDQMDMDEPEEGKRPEFPNISVEESAHVSFTESKEELAQKEDNNAEEREATNPQNSNYSSEEKEDGIFVGVGNEEFECFPERSLQNVDTRRISSGYGANVTVNVVFQDKRTKTLEIACGTTMQFCKNQRKPGFDQMPFDYSIRADCVENGKGSGTKQVTVHCKHQKCYGDENGSGISFNTGKSPASNEYGCACGM